MKTVHLQVYPDNTEMALKNWKIRIHPVRILCALVMFLTFLSVLMFLERPPRCIKVSVSVQQLQPYYVKRTRIVQSVRNNKNERQSNKFIIGTSELRSNVFLSLLKKKAFVLETNKSEIQNAATPKQNINTEVFFRTKLVNVDPDNYENQLESGDIYSIDDDYNDEDESENKIFEEGDFDYNETNSQPDFMIFTQMYDLFVQTIEDGEDSSNSAKLNYSSLKYATAREIPERPLKLSLINIEGVPIVEDAIYWSEDLESSSPKGTPDANAQTILHRLRSVKVKSVETPTWNRCGRPKNQLVVFEDGFKACARYRSPHQYLVLGEVLSFYLARLLGINNVPVVAMSEVFGHQWTGEDIHQKLVAANWESNTTVALIEWIENLERDRLPPLLLSALEKGEMLSAGSSSLLTSNVKQLVELLQWSDLIIFDYVTGNYDRVASMQDAADKERRPSVLRETIHNLVKSKDDGGLWLIDNESGLLDSYSLLYGPAGEDGRFLAFHRQMLNTTCLFRRRTIQRIQWLHKSGRVERMLLDLVKKFEPFFAPIDHLEKVLERLQERIGEVYNHVEYCTELYS